MPQSSFHSQPLHHPIKINIGVKSFYKNRSSLHSSHKCLIVVALKVDRDRAVFRWQQTTVMDFLKTSTAAFVVPTTASG